MDVVDRTGLTGVSAAAVSTPRTDYMGAVPRWQRCRDAIAGSDAVKAAGPTYLPVLRGQSGQDYDAYKTRALFFGAAGRTVAGLSGAISRKPATVQVPDAFALRLEDVTANGRDLDQFAMAALIEVLSVGRFGILADFDGEDTRDALRRPYLVGYRTEDILNWAMTKRQLTMLVLKEHVERQREGNPFAVDRETQYRVFQLVDGQCVVTVAREETRSHRLAVESPIVLQRRGQPLGFIPFVACGPSSLGLQIEKPPLLDLVDTNLSHFRSSADLEHGRHFTALPTPWISGMKVPAESMTIGSSSAWILEDPHAKAGMLEFSGAGLQSLVVALEHKEKLMAILGARLLEGAPRQQETAEAVRLRHSGDEATLRSIATAVSQLLTVSLRTMAWWDDRTPSIDDPTITCDLNQDFQAGVLNPDQLKALILALQAGAISYETFHYQMQKNEMTIPNRSVEEERHAIDSEGAPIHAADDEQEGIGQ